MDLRQLQSFVCVARHGHITRAAQELFITQPALSQQIRRLEQELGATLLTRTAQGVELTPAGADLLPRATAILADVDAARAAMDEHAGARRGVARVAAAAADARGLAAAVASFHAAHPPLRIVLRQGSAQEVLTLLAQGSVDIAISSLAAPAGTTATPLGDEPLVVVAGACDLATAGPGPLPVTALRDQPLILAERGTELRRIVVVACQAEGFSPVPLLEVSDPAAVLTLVRAGLGRCVVPASWAAGEDGVSVRAAVGADGKPLTLRTVLLTGSGALTPAAALLHTHLLEHLGT